jgi:hypothetical protein
MFHNKRFWHWFYLVLFDLEIKLMVGVTGQQRMLTPSSQLIPMLSRYSCLSKSVIYITIRSYEIDHCS